MPSIDDILNNLDLEDETTKEASASTGISEDEIEKQAKELGLLDEQDKTASQQTGGDPDMNLQDFYSMHFGGEVKTASDNTDAQFSSEEGISKEAAAQLENTGELAGVSFAEGLDDRLLAFTIKTAMDAQPDSAATKDIQSGAGVIPGATVANPQLEVNKGEDDDKAMDLTPEYASLLSQAKEKAKIKAAIASGEPKELSHQVVQVNAREGNDDLPVGGSQKDA